MIQTRAMMAWCVKYSKKWKHVDTTWPKFVAELHNIRLGLTLEGVNPYANLSTNHSTWPVLLLNYNLPP
jgi:hypothetical protein